MARVVIVGGGISGLALAYRLEQLGAAVTLLERAGRPGGVIGTVQRDGFRVETGPNGFLDNNPATLSSSDSTFARRASSRCDRFFQRYSRQMLRVNRLAAAIDIIAAGTNAPMAIAAKQNPANHEGKIFRNNAGTT